MLLPWNNRQGKKDPGGYGHVQREMQVKSCSSIKNTEKKSRFCWRKKEIARKIINKTAKQSFYFKTDFGFA